SISCSRVDIIDDRADHSYRYGRPSTMQDHRSAVINHKKDHGAPCARDEIEGVARQVLGFLENFKENGSERGVVRTTGAKQLSNDLIVTFKNDPVQLQELCTKDYIPDPQSLHSYHISQSCIDRGSEVKYMTRSIPGNPSNGAKERVVAEASI
ncbi:hypothetical protein LINGRAHAP2_LOCUS22212, partial [Linum grandiflorum]